MGIFFHIYQFDVYSMRFVNFPNVGDCTTIYPQVPNDCILNGSRPYNQVINIKNIKLINHIVRQLQFNSYVLSMCKYFMSIECIVVKILVAPCTTLSRVSGRTTGVQEAKNTDSFLLQSGTNGR